jgi:hypothetical protein
MEHCFFLLLIVRLFSDDVAVSEIIMYDELVGILMVATVRGRLCTIRFRICGGCEI